MSALILLPAAFALAVILFAGWLWRLTDRPLSDTDRYCAQVDRELDLRRGGGWRL